MIQEPSSSDESSDDEEGDEEPVPQTPAPSPVPAVKKLSRKHQKVEQKIEQKVDTTNKVKVNEILKELNRAIKELFGEFDQKYLDQDDVTYLQNEFNLTLNEAQDMIDPLVENFSDNEIAKV
jgi:Skp family chaperone for outer membrane proteins